MVSKSVTQSPLKTKNKVYTGVLMGYGTIASNGVAHGLKAPKPKILIYKNLYTEPEGLKDSFHGLKSLTIIKPKSAHHNSKGKIETPQHKPQPSSKSKT